MEILLGTRNKGKFLEISELLSDLPIMVVSPDDKGIREDPEESGQTFQENALQKARFYYERGGIPTAADDSGIIVDALKGELGIHTRRWGVGKHATDEEWIAHFLKRMSSEENKKATFVSVVAFLDEQGNNYFFEGRCEGTITPTLEAAYLPGLMMQGCFKPNGFDRVIGNLTAEEKMKSNHRWQAVTQLKHFLSQRLP